MNRVILCGRLTREPEVRYSQTANGSMAVARYTLAVDRAFKKEGEQATLLTVSHLARMESLRRSIFIRGLRLSLRVDGRQAITLTRTDRKSTLMIVLLKNTNFAKVVLIRRIITVMELWAVMLVQTALCQFQMA
jgi:single-stranded DNA-binding protein